MPKRANGEGSITHRLDGRWEARISLPGGKRRSFFGRTRTEVSHKLTDALKAKEDGLPIPSERLTVGKFLEQYLALVASQTLRPRTVERYEGIIRLHLAPAIGRKVLARLAPHEVQSLYNDKMSEGLSRRSVEHIHAVLRRALNIALKWGLVNRNVARLADAPRPEYQEISPLSPSEARVFLDAVRGDRLEALYCVALAVGLRLGEALGLRWRDVDLDSGTLRVTAALQRVNHQLQLVEPKSRRSRRQIALPDSITASLRSHRARQAQELLSLGISRTDNDMVFTSLIGTSLEPANVRRRFQAILKNGGLRRQRFHDLRHACASLLLAQGVHPRVVMEILGHSQIALTMNTYSHVIPSLQRDAARTMDAVLTG